MANTYDQQITGFEGGDFTAMTTLGGTIVAGSARTGKFGLRAAPSATAQYGGRMGDSVAGTKKALFFQFFVKMDVTPSVDSAQLGGLGASTAQIRVNTAMTWDLKIAGFTTVTGGTALPLGKWLRCMVKYWNYTTDVTIFGASTNTRATAQIDDIDTTPGTPVAYGLLIGGGAGNVTTVGLGIMGGQTAEGPSVTWSALHYDDAIYLAAEGTALTSITKWDDTTDATRHRLNNAGSLFHYNRVKGYPPVAQGSQDGFVTAGAYANVNEIPMAAASVSTATAGNRTNYDHQGHENVAPLRLWSDTFEDADALTVDYTDIINAETSSTAGVGGGWGAQTTGTAAQQYNGEFTRGSLNPQGRHGRAQADFDQAFDSNSAAGFYAIEVRLNGTWGISLYHGVGAARTTLQLFVASFSAVDPIATATSAVTPDTFQQLRLDWRTSSLTAAGVANTDGGVDVYVAGVKVMSVTGILLTFLTNNPRWNQVVFGPMGHLDNLWIGDGDPNFKEVPYCEIEAITARVNATDSTAGSHVLELDTTALFTGVFNSFTGSADASSRYGSVIYTGTKGELTARETFDRMEFGMKH